MNFFGCFVRTLWLVDAVSKPNTINFLGKCRCCEQGEMKKNMRLLRGKVPRAQKLTVMMVTVVRRMVMAGIEVLALLLSAVGSIVLQLSVSHLDMEGLRGSMQKILLTRTGQRGQ